MFINKACFSLKFSKFKKKSELFNKYHHYFKEKIKIYSTKQ